jgi:hypothetical protein
MLIKSAKSWTFLHLLILVALSLALATFKYKSVLAEDRSLAFEGDAWGTMGWVEDIRQRFETEGLSALYGDIYYTTGIGGGTISNGVPINPLWRTLYGPTRAIVSTSNMHDALAVASFLFTLATFIALARALELPLVLGFLAGIFYVQSDNFYLRQTSHLSLASAFTATLLVVSILKMYKEVTLRSMSFFALSLVINFLWNEYYGFFGLVISLVIAPRLMATIYRAEHRQRNFLIKAISLTGIATLVAMCALYPNLIGAKIIRIFGIPSDATPAYAHSDADFHSYALRNPIPIFKTGIQSLAKIIPDAMANPVATPEMTYRIGVLIPIICVISFLYKVKKYRKSELVLWSIALIGYSLSLTIKDPGSLAKLTLAVAPMFRCSVRALIYTNIAFLGLLIIAIQKVCLIVTAESLKRQVAILGMTTAATVLALSDYSAGRSLLDQYPVVDLPRLKIFEDLSQREIGHLINFPVMTPPSEPPEADYTYFLARRVHRMPILNGFPHSFNSYRIQHFYRFNDIPDDIATEFGKMNIRYIAVHPSGRWNFSKLNSVRGLKKLVEIDGHKLFEVEGVTGPFVPATFQNLFWNPKSFSFNSNHFTNARRDFPINSSPPPLLIPPNRNVTAKVHLPLTPGTYRFSISGKVGASKSSQTAGYLTWRLGNDETKYSDNRLEFAPTSREYPFNSQATFKLDIDNVLRPDFFNSSKMDIFLTSISVDRIE